MNKCIKKQVLDMWTAHWKNVDFHEIPFEINRIASISLVSFNAFVFALLKCMDFQTSDLLWTYAESSVHFYRFDFFSIDNQIVHQWKKKEYESVIMMLFLKVETHKLNFNLMVVKTSIRNYSVSVLKTAWIYTVAKLVYTIILH